MLRPLLGWLTSAVYRRELVRDLTDDVGEIDQQVIFPREVEKGCASRVDCGALFDLTVEPPQSVLVETISHHIWAVRIDVAAPALVFVPDLMGVQIPEWRFTFIIFPFLFHSLLKPLLILFHFREILAFSLVGVEFLESQTDQPNNMTQRWRLGNL